MGGHVGAPHDNWPAYWETLPERRIFAVEAADYVARLHARLGLDPAARVLDFGCGFGFVAALLAPRVGHLAAWDAAAPMRLATRRRLAGQPNARVLDEAPDAAGGRFDLILVNSVVQYMTAAELDDWLPRWRALLAPGGRLVLSDVITGRAPAPLRELAEFVALGARRGALLHALRDGVSALRRYTEARRARPLARLDPAALAPAAAALGLTLTVLERNLAYRSGRSTLVLTAPPAGGGR